MAGEKTTIRVGLCGGGGARWEWSFSELKLLMFTEKMLVRGGVKDGKVRRRVLRVSEKPHDRRSSSKSARTERTESETIVTLVVLGGHRADSKAGGTGQRIHGS